MFLNGKGIFFANKLKLEEPTSDGKVLESFFFYAQSPGVMPFYGDSGAGFRPAGFGNTVWHQGVGPVGAVAVETSPAPWPPQQFIQQISAPNQLEELRYHTQYGAATPYHPQAGECKTR